ncbi:MAG: large conductance mechanosensitive channel protein MscL [Oscillospiraceae bacterium]|nr:large conductance mechanosensitive channel protein MscL [Oscillospiraceae bacterium]
MAKKDKKGIFSEFKEFALQGNLFDMATGVLIGGVFKDLVSSFTNNIIMPIIGIFTGSVNFSSWKLALPSIFGDKLDEEGNVIVNYLNVGDFISSIITFFILAWVIFLMIKGMNSLRALAKKNSEEEKKEEAPPEPSAEEKLLMEIRDLLKKK